MFPMLSGQSHWCQWKERVGTRVWVQRWQTLEEAYKVLCQHQGKLVHYWLYLSGESLTGANFPGIIKPFHRTSREDTSIYIYIVSWSGGRLWSPDVMRTPWRFTRITRHWFLLFDLNYWCQAHIARKCQIIIINSLLWQDMLKRKSTQTFEFFDLKKTTTINDGKRDCVCVDSGLSCGAHPVCSPTQPDSGQVIDHTHSTAYISLNYIITLLYSA